MKEKVFVVVVVVVLGKKTKMDYLKGFFEARVKKKKKGGGVGKLKSNCFHS